MTLNFLNFEYLCSLAVCTFKFVCIFANCVSCFCVCLLPKNLFVTSVKFLLNGSNVGAKLQATNRVPRPVDRETATRYGG